MDKRWKNMVLLLIIIGALLFLTYFFQGGTLDVTGSGVSIFP